MKLILSFILFVFAKTLLAQNGLVNTMASPFAKLQPVGLNEVKFTGGFWAERMTVCTNEMVPRLWKTYTSDSFCFAFKNFRIAAGLDTGKFRGPSFHDGDFYKTLEAMAAAYAYSKDEKLNTQMDAAIEVIAKAQKEDGYIYTKSIIEQKKSGNAKMFDDKLSFEAYNFGHLMTAACVHFRATGKPGLLDIAKKATNFLIDFYKHASPEQARNALCPSHYMGIAEMYRTTGDTAYVQLLKHLIDIRGTAEGSADNSDAIPFRKMSTVNGHAVRANYLFAGVADLYAETGDESLLLALDLLWEDVVNHKMYITGGCGALYDGLSLEGITYKPDSLQKIQQAYGKDYELPNLTAHNETCANIGNVLWNWRMFLLTADSKYADLVELELYNAVLSGVNLEGNKFFYTNPLAVSNAYPYRLRWSGGRQSYISKSNCCAPNLVRTIAEVNNYMYSIGKGGLYVNLYGSNHLKTVLHNGSSIEVQQNTAYPWDGKINLSVVSYSGPAFNIYLRIPEWCKNYTIKVNNRLLPDAFMANGFIGLTDNWKTGDKIELILQMHPVLMESNPLVEASKNQVAVKRGPIVYCLESASMSNSQQIADMLIPASIQFKTMPVKIGRSNMVGLEGNGKMLQYANWGNNLYRELNAIYKPVTIKLIPYFAWANRGAGEMTVWMNLIR
jgi:DUF1680 family protein